MTIRLKLQISATMGSLTELQLMLDRAEAIFPKEFLRRLQVDQEARADTGYRTNRRLHCKGTIRKLTPPKETT